MKRRPVDQYYYSKEEWERLGCGPLPPERDIALKNSQDVDWKFVVYPEDDGYDRTRNPYSSH
jgi:hypothetical protein